MAHNFSGSIQENSTYSSDSLDNMRSKNNELQQSVSDKEFFKNSSLSIDNNDALFTVQIPTYRWRLNAGVPRYLVPSHTESKMLFNDINLNYFENYLEKKLSYQEGNCLRLFSTYNDEKRKAITRIQRFWRKKHKINKNIRN